MKETLKTAATFAAGIAGVWYIALRIKAMVKK